MYPGAGFRYRYKRGAKVRKRTENEAFRAEFPSKSFFFYDTIHTTAYALVKGVMFSTNLYSYTIQVLSSPAYPSTGEESAICRRSKVSVNRCATVRFSKLRVQ